MPLLNRGGVSNVRCKKRTSWKMDGRQLRVCTMGVSDDQLKAAFQGCNFSFIRHDTNNMGSSILLATWTLLSDAESVELSLLQFSNPTDWSPVHWEEFVVRVRGQCPWGSLLSRSTFPYSMWSTFANTTPAGLQATPLQIYVDVRLLLPPTLTNGLVVPVVRFNLAKPFEDLISVMVEHAKRSLHRQLKRQREEERKHERQLVLERDQAQDCRVQQAVASKYDKQMELMMTTKVDRRLASITRQLSAFSNRLVVLENMPRIPPSASSAPLPSAPPYSASDH